MPEQVQFTLPYPPNPAKRREWAKRYSLNAYWAGKHWSQRKQDADFWHGLVTAQMAHQKVPRKLFARAVKITFSWNDRLDIDNHAAMAKLIVDAMKGWLLQNDSRRWYAGCEHKFHDRDYILVEVEEL